MRWPQSICLAAALFLGLMVTSAEAMTPRQRIIECWKLGYGTTSLMQKCTNLQIDALKFEDCITQEECFNEPPIEPLDYTAPRCGGFNSLPCPQAMACGRPDTIACPDPTYTQAPACGSAGYPPCRQAITCGPHSGLFCPGFCGVPGTPPCPFCGSHGLPYCPIAQICGTPFSIDCPGPAPRRAATCGKNNVPCNTDLACGQSGAFSCYHNVDWDELEDAALDRFTPAIQFTIPGSVETATRQRNSIALRFAAPAIPDQASLERCFVQAAGSSGSFETCLEDVLPQGYRLTRDCMTRHSNNRTFALLCSTGNQELINKYNQFNQVRSCAQAMSDEAGIAQCLGLAGISLPPQVSYYVGCARNNRDSYGGMAACALAPELTPEQQIALSCGVTSAAGGPGSYTACVGGQLVKRELGKCLTGGIATDDGCFGPNNEIRRYLDKAENLIGDAFGRGSAIYQAFSIYKNNVLAPGAGHDLVRAVNTVLNDLTHGIGKGNDLMKIGEAVGSVLQPVANVLSGGIRF